MKSDTLFVAIEGHAENWEEAIRACGTKLHEIGSVGPAFTDACIEREKEYPTGLPSEIPVAIPHCFSSDIYANTVCFLRTDTPVTFTRMDDDEEQIDARLIFNIAIKAGDDHLLFLQKLMDLVMDTEHLQNVLDLPMDQIPAYLEDQLDLTDAS